MNSYSEKVYIQKQWLNTPKALQKMAEVNTDDPLYSFYIQTLVQRCSATCNFHKFSEKHPNNFTPGTLQNFHLIMDISQQLFC